MLSTCGRGPGPPRVGLGPPRAIRTPADGSGTSTCHPDSRKLSTQLAAREGSGAATCPGSSGRHGHCCGGYHPPGMAWRRSEGPTGQGLVPVRAEAASEGRAHAVRGLRGRESTKEVWGVGSIVAEAVPSTSCTTSQVPTVSPQCPEWRSSYRSWRTGLRSQPLWGMAS